MSFIDCFGNPEKLIHVKIDDLNQSMLARRSYGTREIDQTVLANINPRKFFEYLVCENKFT